MTIYESMVGIMRDVKSISKDSHNRQQGFKFRGIDAVYNELHGLLAKYGVFTTSKILSEHHEERRTKNGGVLIYRVYQIEYTFHAEDGTCVSSSVIGEGMDSGDKASNKAMAIADKYCLLQAFKIPTEEMTDPDSESHDIAAPEPTIKPGETDVTIEKVLEKMASAKTVEALTAFAGMARELPKDMQEVVRTEYNARKAKLQKGVENEF